MHRQTILIVEDDARVRAVLRNLLEDDGFAVREAETAAEVSRALDADDICLSTLDIHLGRENGIELAAMIRRRSEVPIIMITGKDDVIDRVVGLEVGADDYITKPFHLREVIARVRSVLRRAAPREVAPMPAAANLPEPLADEGLQYRFDGMTAVPDRLLLIDREGADCGLTSGDYRLLSVFLERPRRILSRDQLMDLTGGTEWSPLDRTIDNQVARLRKKIERDPSSPQLIKTVRGVGYTFAVPVDRVQGSDDISCKSA